MRLQRVSHDLATKQKNKIIKKKKKLEAMGETMKNLTEDLGTIFAQVFRFLSLRHKQMKKNESDRQGVP